jgi:hypothetical protein
VRLPRFLTDPADTVSLVLFLSMVVLALTWIVRLLGWR